MPKKKVKFDPNEPMELVMERLEPVYGSDGQRERAKTDHTVVEQGKRAAYAILKNGGARTGPELEALEKAVAAKKPKPTEGAKK